MTTTKPLLVAPFVVAALVAVPLPGQAQVAPAAAALPGFLSGATEGEPTDIAVGYLTGAADSYGVGAADVADLEVRTAYVSKHTGVTHVNVFQRFKGLEVFGATATVNVARDGSVIHVGETLVADLADGADGRAENAPVEAVEAAAEALELDEPEGLRALPSARGADGEVVLTDGGISAEPIPTRLGWQPTEDGLRLAYQVVIDEAEDVHLWNAVVDAETGELLDLDDWTIEHDHDEMISTLARHDDQFDAADGHDHADDHAPSTHGSNDPVQDGSAYNVLEIPKESPNDGPFTVVENPADGLASPFGWHDTDGVAGPEHTTTRGNNVHAYLDQDANNLPDPGQDTDGGADLQFRFEADLSEHSADYRDAAVTNLFYLNNVIHDVMYLYGFDEVSGNFQASNYDRGGVGGDQVRAEAADGSGNNNANFSTPAADGGPPRMQMYLWPGAQFGLPNGVTVDGTTYGANFARFGPPALNAGVSGALVVAGTGCTADAYPADAPAGFVAVVDGLTTGEGSCTNPVRTATAEVAGASALVVAATTDAAPAILTGSQAAGPVGIPAVSVSQADGAALKAAAGTTASVHKASTHPGVRDGDLENGIIIHEYGHGISNRLTGGPGINCLSGNEQMGEGWSDYYAITMLLDPSIDDPEDPRGMGPYALFQPDRTGNGIRPRPYSRNMEIQPFTYDRIKTGGWLTGGSLAVPHGIGHAWSATLWDMTWDLVERHGFNDNIYDPWNAGGNNRSLQYVTDGLKMQGCAPGFLAGRDGILAAELALTGGEDRCLIWGAFARRGLGVSAVQGTTNRDDNTEAFDVPADCRATGPGVTGPRPAADGLITRAAGSTIPVDFGLGGDRGLDVLKPSHSPASQQIDCTTLQPLQYAITTPTRSPGATTLRYNTRLDRYTYQWQTEEAWGGTCRQLIITLADGTQHRTNVKVLPSTEG